MIRLLSWRAAPRPGQPCNQVVFKFTGPASAERPIIIITALRVEGVGWCGTSDSDMERRILTRIAYRCLISSPNNHLLFSTVFILLFIQWRETTQQCFFFFVAVPSSKFEGLCDGRKGKELSAGFDDWYCKNMRRNSQNPGTGTRPIHRSKSNHLYLDFASFVQESFYSWEQATEAEPYQLEPSKWSVDFYISLSF